MMILMMKDSHRKKKGLCREKPPISTDSIKQGGDFKQQLTSTMQKYSTREELEVCILMTANASEILL